MGGCLHTWTVVWAVVSVRELVVVIVLVVVPVVLVVIVAVVACWWYGIRKKGRGVQGLTCIGGR